MVALSQVMYIEDDQDIQAVVQLALESIGGYKVRIESCGHEALETLKTWQPQLILLDVMMPGMDGPTFYAHISKLDYAKNIPVIFITAKVQKNEIENYYKLGAVGVITKPFDPMQLATEVKQIWTKIEEKVV